MALAVVLPAVANAELLKNLKVGGQLDVQTTAARNVLDFATRPNTVAGNTPLAANNDRIGHAMTRVMLKMDWDLLDDVHSRVTLVKGAAATTAAGQARDYGQNAEDLNTIQTNTLLQEAFVKVVKLFGFADFTLGRQFYGEPGDLSSLGPRETTADRERGRHGRFDWNGEMVIVTGQDGKSPNGAGDRPARPRGLLQQNENVKVPPTSKSGHSATAAWARPRKESSCRRGHRVQADLAACWPPEFAKTSAPTAPADTPTTRAGASGRLRPTPDRPFTPAASSATAPATRTA